MEGKNQMHIPKLSIYDIRRKIRHVSPSQMNMVTSCKFKWACRYLYDMQPRVKKSQMLNIGIFFHDIAKRASFYGKEYAFDRNKIIEEMDLTIEDSKTFTKAEYPLAVDKFLEAYGGLDIKNENTEVPVSGFIDGINTECIGFIDHIAKIDGEERIIDLKIKSHLNKDFDGNPVFSDNERLQQGIYSYFTKIPIAYLYIINIGRTRKNDKVKFLKAKKVFDQKEMDTVIELAKMAVEEMYSGNYTPNRNSAWCNYNMCEYWDQCHEVWG